MRIERENCCDDLASTACGNVAVCAGALTALEEFCSVGSGRVTLLTAADGGQRGNLLLRIQRLVDGTGERRFSSWWLFGASLGVICLVVASALVWNTKQVAADEEVASQVDPAVAADVEAILAVMMRFDAEYRKTVNVPDLLASGHVAWSADAKSLALAHGKWLFVVDVDSGNADRFAVPGETKSIRWSGDAVFAISTLGRETRFQLRRDSLQVVDSRGQPVNVRALVQARIGYPSGTSAWSRLGSGTSPIPLTGLSDGTHWLVAQPHKAVFHLRRTMTDSVSKRHLPEPLSVPNNVFASVSTRVNNVGNEVFRVEITNHSGDALQFTELDIDFDVTIAATRKQFQVLSPQWTNDASSVHTFEIENGKTQFFELDWNDWAARGLWSNRAPLGPGPWSRKDQTGKMWARIHGPGFETVPFLVTPPRRTNFPIANAPNIEAPIAKAPSGATAAVPPPIPPRGSVDKIQQPAGMRQVQSRADAEVTEQLFRQYITAYGKIATEQVNAAIKRVARRGASDAEFTKLVIEEFKENYDARNGRGVKRNVLTLMGRMLAFHGARRWQQEYFERTGQIGQAALPGGVEHLSAHEAAMLDQILTRGRKADRGNIAEFVMAIRLAHHPRGKQFLLVVLQNPSSTAGPFEDATQKGKWPDTVGGGWSDAEFLAAVGLAELGESIGVEWLIQQTRPNNFGLDDTLYKGGHLRAKTDGMRENCNCVLADLSELRLDSGFAGWTEWWSANKKAFSPRAVSLKIQ